MKTVQIVLVLWGAICCGVAAENKLHATLEPQTNRPGSFVVHITNVSSNVVRFLDVPEGSGFCGDFYEVTCERGGKRASSQGNTFYAPAIEPKVVAIAPGQTYDRQIQPGAYLYEARVAAVSEITVSYRVSARMRDAWARSSGADLALTFHTDTTANQQGGVNGRQPIRSETNGASTGAASRRSP